MLSLDHSPVHTEIARCNLPGRFESRSRVLAVKLEGAGTFFTLGPSEAVKAGNNNQVRVLTGKISTNTWCESRVSALSSFSLSPSQPAHYHENQGGFRTKAGCLGHVSELPCCYPGPLCVRYGRNGWAQVLSVIVQAYFIPKAACVFSTCGHPSFVM